LADTALHAVESIRIVKNGHLIKHEKPASISYLFFYDFTSPSCRLAAIFFLSCLDDSVCVCAGRERGGASHAHFLAHDPKTIPAVTINFITRPKHIARSYFSFNPLVSLFDVRSSKPHRFEKSLVDRRLQEFYI
jgi:hypothetical protein